MSSPFDAPTANNASENADLEAIHAELSRAKLPQYGVGGCGLLAALVALGFALMMLVVGLIGLATAGAESVMVIGVALLYGLIGLFYAAPAYLLVRAAMALSSGGGRGEQLLLAARYHRLLWQVVAGMVVSVFALYFLMFVGIMTLGASLNSTFDDIATELENVE